ncbi:hypothetical protein Tco_0507617 [Tanacetum coccineum]
MTTLADKSLLSGGDNKPPMLEKHLYDSWKSIMELYMMNRPHGRMILASVEKGPLVWPSITEDGVTVYMMWQKDLWEKIKLLMQGTSLTKQERECKLYDEFDKFTYKKGESLHEYYLRFTLLLNDMNIYKMPLEQFQDLPDSSKPSDRKLGKSKPKLVCRGITILKMDIIVIPDSDETLELCEESRSKILLKEQDPLFLKELPTVEYGCHTSLNVLNAILLALIRNWCWVVIAALKNELELKGKGNTKNDRILQTPSSNLKNKVEAHPRNVKSSLNKRNGTVKGYAVVQNLKKQDNSDYVCINRDDCMSSVNLCVSNSMNDVKFHAKSKKHKSKKDIWKPTGKVFTQIGYIWRPTVLDSESPKLWLNWYTQGNLGRIDYGLLAKTEVVKSSLVFGFGARSTYVPGVRSQLTNFISQLTRWLLELRVQDPALRNDSCINQFSTRAKTLLLLQHHLLHLRDMMGFVVSTMLVTSDQSSSQTLFITIVVSDHHVSDTIANGRWITHLENIIGALDRPVSHTTTLNEQALFCYYEPVLTSVETKNYKEA